LRILLYGRLADAIDRQVEIDAPAGWSVANVREQLTARHPDAAEVLDRSRAVIAGSLVGDGRVLNDDDCVEFLPPVSGG
jgi:sulfur-carrier protein